MPPVSQETFERMKLAKKKRRAKERQKENFETAGGIGQGGRQHGDFRIGMKTKK